MNPFPIPAAYLYAAAFLAGAYAMHTWHKAQRVDRVEQVRETEFAGAAIGNQAQVRHLERLVDLRQHAEANAGRFRRALDETDAALRSCRVSGALVRLLDDAGDPAPAGVPGRAVQPPADAAPARDSTADVELATCRRNYAEVCAPNARQLRDLIDWYEELRGKYNR